MICLNNKSSSPEQLLLMLSCFILIYVVHVDQHTANAFQISRQSTQYLKTKNLVQRFSTSQTDTSSSTTTSSSDIQQRDSWDKEAWIQGYSTVETESCYELEGDFPKDLEGTFYQNGHAKFQVGDEIIVHPFDGDGMVAAITFQNGKAWFRNRFVQTPGYLQELEENKICQRGLFGTAKNKGSLFSNIFDLNFKTVANTGVVTTNKGNRLFALWEGDLPFELDPVTLETIGQSDLDQTLNKDEGDRYSAHYKIDPRNGNICNFAILPGTTLDPNENHITLVTEHDSDLNLIYKCKHVLPGFGIAHDCAMSENYIALFKPPCKFKPLPLVLGRKGAAECILWDDSGEGGKLFLLPRSADGEPIIVDTPPCFSFHICNAFEETDSEGKNPNLVIDVIMGDKLKMADTESKSYPERPIWETVDFTNDIPAYQLSRYRVDLKTRKLLSTDKMTQGACANVDFPMIHPAYTSRPYKYAWCLSSPGTNQVSPVQGLIKVDVEAGEVLQKWIPESHEFLAEVIFVPRSEKEDDGYLMGYLMNGKEKKTSLVIFDAADVAQGPISKTELQGTFLSHLLHGHFVPGLTPNMDDKVLASFEKN